MTVAPPPLVAALRISPGDPQFSLNLGGSFGFVAGGCCLNVLRVMDHTQIWSLFVTAQGAPAGDPRRGFASAVARFMS